MHYNNKSVIIKMLSIFVSIVTVFNIFSLTINAINISRENQREKAVSTVTINKMSVKTKKIFDDADNTPHMVTVHKEAVAEKTTVVSPVASAEINSLNNAVSTENMVNLGNFKLTAYCACKKCCGKYAVNRPIDENGNEIIYTASGNRAVDGLTIAVDPKVIPLGSTIVINGHEYVAMDTGGAVKGNVIDIFFASHEAALAFGCKHADVYLKK